MVAFSESARVMKVVLTVADIATIFLLWKWLRRVGLNEWLVLTYAWNPVSSEVAHRGHIVRSARSGSSPLRTGWRTADGRSRPSRFGCRGHQAAADCARSVVHRGVRVRDLALGASVLAALYLPFAIGTELPVGAVPNVVAHIRFNSPVFRPLAWIVSPGWAASLAPDRDRRRGVGAREARHQ